MNKIKSWALSIVYAKSNFPNKSTSNHDTQNQVTVGSASVQAEIRGLTCQISPEFVLYKEGE